MARPRPLTLPSRSSPSAADRMVSWALRFLRSFTPREAGPSEEAAVLPVTLQDSVDRFGRSLEVPQRLISLHPRKLGYSGNYAALPPAVVIGVISAFEGFAEDFLAIALHLRGYGLGQIAKKVSINNPTVSTLQAKCLADFPEMVSRIGKGFSLQLWSTPGLNGRPTTETIFWPEVLKRADGWMEVRHCLTHGLTSGWRSEIWPGPLRGTISASSVLRAMPAGKHSIGILGAITCARIYTYGARHLARGMATELADSIDWSPVPEFPLKAAPAEH